MLRQFFQLRQRNRRNVLIVGSDSRAVSFAQKISASRSQVVGFIDDQWEFDGATPYYKSLRLGKHSQIRQVLRDTAVDEVAVMSLGLHPELNREIVDACLEQGIKIVRSTESASLKHLRTGLPLLAAATPQTDSQNRLKPALKRLIDTVCSGIVLVAIGPLLVIIALAIKISSNGPALFCQERLGVGKRPFRIFKFRTMVPDAESLMASIEHLNEATGAHFKLRQDPRITPLGRWLRKTSLDELPQLFNVLRGDMSLVGPRPIVMRDYRGIANDRHRRRFTVKPGITCLWQVGGRSSIDFDRWMELDLEYIDQWSLRLDFQILLKTIPVVIRGSGAM